MKLLVGYDDNGFEYEIYKKTQKREKPKNCFECDKRIKKGMYYTISDAGEEYCLECCIIK